jgi:hypothetical protein
VTVDKQFNSITYPHCTRVFESTLIFLISNFYRVLNVVFFILGDSPASDEFYVPAFRKVLFYLIAFSSHLFFLLTPPMKMGLTKCSETSAHKIQTPGNHPKERILHYSYFLRSSTSFYLFVLGVDGYCYI